LTVNFYCAGITTTAKEDGGGFVISGGKMWTTNGAQVLWYKFADYATQASRDKKTFFADGGLVTRGGSGRGGDWGDRSP